MDDALLERMLSAPGQAAGEEPELAMLLAAASTFPFQSGPLVGEVAALAAFRSAGAAPSRRKRMLGKALAAKTLAGLAAGTLTLGGGVAAAATDNLPAPVQDKVSGVVSHVGIDFPNSHGKHLGWTKGHNPHGTSTTDGTDEQGTDAQQPSTDDQQSGQQPDNHGADVSKVATDPTQVGGTNDNHGGAVSKVARDNNGQQQSSSSSTKGSDESSQHATDGQQKGADARASHQPTDPGSQGTDHGAGG